MRRAASLALVTVACAVVAAQAQPAGRPALELRAPEGPVTVTADRAEFERSGVMRYRGNVRLVSKELVLTGHSLELRQPVEGQYEAHITGRPARLTHAAEGEEPPITASAGTITYDTQNALVELTQGAQLERGNDLLSGDHIHYDVAARRIRANGTNGGQVRIVIQPPKRESEDTSP